MQEARTTRGTERVCNRDGDSGLASRSVRVPLHRIAHGRSGDKGNRQNISVIAYRPEAWPVLLAEVTEERVLELFRHRGATSARRFELARLQALNFVIENALEGGVNAALALDTHGKTAAFRLLSMQVEAPADLVAGGSLSPADVPQQGRPA